MFASHLCVFYATHVSAKGVNCTACGSGIMCASQFVIASSIATAHKNACASKSIVQFILSTRSVAFGKW